MKLLNSVKLRKMFSRNFTLIFQTNVYGVTHKSSGLCTTLLCPRFACSNRMGIFAVRKCTEINNSILNNINSLFVNSSLKGHCFSVRRAYGSDNNKYERKKWSRLLISSIVTTIGITIFVNYEAKRIRGPKTIFKNYYNDKNQCILLGVDNVFLPTFCESTYDKVKEFKVQDDDVYVISFPKSGTTWVLEIAYLIQNGLDFEKAARDNIEYRCPYLEFLYPGVREMNKVQKSNHESRVIKTHLPLGLLPKEIINKNCKIIYIARNPKDVSVSMFHFMRLLKQFSKFDGEFNQYFESFLSGKVQYGPWWTHVKEYWKMHEKDNILFLKYEDLQKNLAEQIYIIGQFLGKSLTQKECQVLAHHCSFQAMKKNPKTNYAWWENLGIANKQAEPFMRKGKVGDWKNYFTPEQEKRLDTEISKQLKDTGLTFDYNI